MGAECQEEASGCCLQVVHRNQARREAQEGRGEARQGEGDAECGGRRGGRRESRVG